MPYSGRLRVKETIKYLPYASKLPIIDLQKKKKGHPLLSVHCIAQQDLLIPKLTVAVVAAAAASSSHKLHRQEVLP